MRDETLNRAALALAAACVIAIVVTLGVLGAPVVRMRLGLTASPASYSVGETIDVPRSAYAGARHTLVLFTRSNCATSQRVKPLLKALVAEMETREVSRVVMVTGTANQPDEVEFASELGLGRDRMISVSPGSVKARHVPTIVLVDDRGTVLYAQEGAPNKSDSDVSAAIMSLVDRH